jgi:hypothetical protein
VNRQLLEEISFVHDSTLTAYQSLVRVIRVHLRLISLSLLPFMIVSAQKNASHRQEKTSSPTQTASELARTRAEFVKATKEYKESLRKLLELYETDARRAEARLKQQRELYAQGLIARREVDASEDELKTKQNKINEVKTQLANADKNIADAFLEAEAEEKERITRRKNAQIAKDSRANVPLTATATMMRYNGAGAFSLTTGAVEVQQFFLSRFNRALPVSAYGQTAVHDRLGFDHRNAMDVAVSPDSAEGRELIAFLQARRIPFIAFRHAVPGSATGAHIHIGLPSHRIAR